MTISWDETVERGTGGALPPMPALPAAFPGRRAGAVAESRHRPLGVSRRRVQLRLLRQNLQPTGRTPETPPGSARRPLVSLLPLPPPIRHQSLHSGNPINQY